MHVQYVRKTTIKTLVGLKLNIYIYLCDGQFLCIFHAYYDTGTISGLFTPVIDVKVKGGALSKLSAPGALWPDTINQTFLFSFAFVQLN